MLKFLIILFLIISFSGCSQRANQLPTLERVGSTSLRYTSKECDGNKIHIFTHEQLLYVKSELYRLGYNANSCIDTVNGFNEINKNWWEFR